MPRDINGNYTLPLADVIPHTVIEAEWANPTMHDLADGLTDSLSRSGLGGMLAPFKFADGNLAAPGQSWVNEPTSGMYRFGSGDVRYAIQGTPVLQMQAAQLNALVPLVTPASAAPRAGLRLPHGVAPAAPGDGDLWTTNIGLFAQINGVTQQYLAVAGGTVGPLTTTGTFTINHAGAAPQILITGKSVGGDSMRLYSLAAGSGAQLEARNNAGSDFEPWTIAGEVVDIYGRTGVATIARGLRVQASAGAPTSWLTVTAGVAGSTLFADSSGADASFLFQVKGAGIFHWLDTTATKDRARLVLNPAGSGVSYESLTGGLTDYSPVILRGNFVDVFARTGALATAIITRTNNLGLMFPTDNTLDIGQIASNRPRTGYFGTSVIVGGASDATDKIIVKGISKSLQLGTAADSSRIVGLSQDSASYQPLFINASEIRFLTSGAFRWVVNDTALIPSVDNTTDIGSAALRVRTGYFGTSVGIGAAPNFGGYGGGVLTVAGAAAGTSVAAIEMRGSRAALNQTFAQMDFRFQNTVASSFLFNGDGTFTVLGNAAATALVVTPTQLFVPVAVAVAGAPIGAYKMSLYTDASALGIALVGRAGDNISLITFLSNNTVTQQSKIQSNVASFDIYHGGVVAMSLTAAKVSALLPVEFANGALNTAAGLGNVSRYLVGDFQHYAPAGGTWRVINQANTVQLLALDDAGTTATFGGTVIGPTATAAKASLRAPHGVAPAAPVNGDIWTTAAGLFARISGANVGPFGAAGAPGRLVQSVSHNRGDYVTGAVLIPFDDTIPQITEGFEFFSVAAYTPQAIGNRIRVRALCNFTCAVAAGMTAAVFQSGTANALGVGMVVAAAGTDERQISIEYEFIAASVAPFTYSLRAGASDGSALRLNGRGVRSYGGAMNSYLRIDEYSS